jgi:uncharacterized OB-fold protein
MLKRGQKDNINYTFGITGKQVKEKKEAAQQHHTCPHCGRVSLFKTNFCPSCGENLQ